MEKELLDFNLEVKQDDVEDNGKFRGMVSPFGGKGDAGGDIVSPGAFTNTLKRGGRNGNGIPFLFNHDRDSILGTWDDFAEEKRGLIGTGQFELETQLGKEKHILTRKGAIKGLSIGFNTITFEIIDKGRGKPRTRILKEIELWEVSLVTFPMQTRATVTDVKSIMDAKTVRELENALRESGLSKVAAQYVVKLCTPSLRESGGVSSSEKQMRELLVGLKDFRNDLIT